MNAPPDTAKERVELERLEMEALRDSPEVTVYAGLLTIYLIENDLPNAKFLWKRIPDLVKQSHPELVRLWSVGQALIGRSPPAAFAALDPKREPWPNSINNCVTRLTDALRYRYLHVVGKVYSSISLSDFSHYVGLAEAEALQLARLQPGWGFDEASNMVLPQKLEQPISKTTHTEEKLSQLTDFVAFLEKC